MTETFERTTTCRVEGLGGNEAVRLDDGRRGEVEWGRCALAVRQTRRWVCSHSTTRGSKVSPVPTGRWGRLDTDGQVQVRTDVVVTHLLQQEVVGHPSCAELMHCVQRPSRALHTAPRASCASPQPHTRIWKRHSAATSRRPSERESGSGLRRQAHRLLGTRGHHHVVGLPVGHMARVCAHKPQRVSI